MFADTPTGSPQNPKKNAFGAPSYDFDAYGFPETPTISVSQHFDTKDFKNYFFKANDDDDNDQTDLNQQEFNGLSVLKEQCGVQSETAVSLGYDSTVEQVSKYVNDLTIDGISFPQLASTFKDEFIDGKLFLNLTKADLNHLGCYEFAKRNKLYNHIQYLKSVVVTSKPIAKKLKSSASDKTDTSLSSGEHLDGVQAQPQTQVKQTKSLNLPSKINTAQMIQTQPKSSHVITSKQQENSVGSTVVSQSSNQKLLFTPQQQFQTAVIRQPHTAPIVSSPQARLLVNSFQTDHSSTSSSSFNTPAVTFFPQVRQNANVVQAPTDSTRRYSDIVTNKMSAAVVQSRTKSESYSSVITSKKQFNKGNRKSQSHNHVQSPQKVDKFFEVAANINAVSRSIGNGKKLITFPAIFRDIYADTKQANVLIRKQTIHQLNKIAANSQLDTPPVWDTNTISHVFYLDIQIKQKRSNNGWLVFNKKKQTPINMPHYSLVYLTIDLETLSVTQLEPIQICGYVRNVEYSRSPNKFDSVWVESVLSMQATEYHHYFDKKDPNSQKLQDIIAFDLKNYNAECYDNFKRGCNNEMLKQNVQKNNSKDYLPLKYKNDQYSTSCLVNDVKSHHVRYQKFDKVRFCMKLAQITNMKSSSKERNVFIQAWAVKKSQ